MINYSWHFLWTEHLEDRQNMYHFQKLLSFATLHSSTFQTKHLCTVKHRNVYLGLLFWVPWGSRENHKDVNSCQLSIVLPVTWRHIVLFLPYQKAIVSYITLLVFFFRIFLFLCSRQKFSLSPDSVCIQCNIAIVNCLIHVLPIRLHYVLLIL